MAWIESHQTVWAHAKTRKAARHLGIPDVQLVGHLHALWHWALDHAEDGDLSRYDTEDIAIAARWEGDPDKFMVALSECGPGGGHGYIQRDNSGTRLRNWGRYTDGLMARREAGRKANHDRWHVARGVRQDGCEWCTDSVPSPTGVRSDSDRTPDLLRSESTNLTNQPNQPTKPVERAKPRRASVVPDGWQPPDDVRADLAAKHPGVDLARELEKFRNHHQAKGTTFKDHAKAYRNWIARAEEWGTGNQRAGPPAHNVSEFSESGRVQP